jgi:Heparinase II/III-like protein/Heparinase II/III N-terminus
MDRQAGRHGVADKVVWYGRRLGTMTGPELVWRCRQSLRGVLPRRDLADASGSRLLQDGVDGWRPALQRFRDGVGRPLVLDRSRAETIREGHPDLVNELVAAAERVASGRVTYFGYPEAVLGDSVDWHHDPLSGFRWPRLPSAKIDHRAARGDPKWIWELNRLQHLPWLAQAWLFTGQESFAELAFDQLDSWMDQNPPGFGIAWRGSFEAGVRAISVAVALQGLRDSQALTVRRFERVVRMLASSAARCWRDRSRFSSANNHLVGELAGLAAVALLLPDLRPAQRWLHNALSGLSEQAGRQILPDGAGAEQAVGYQMFTVELLVVVAVLLGAEGKEVPPAVLAAINRSSDYLATLVDANDPPLRYGDDDEGFALRLGPEPLRTIREHLGLVGAFTSDERARLLGQETLSSLWIEAALRPSGGAAPRPAPQRPVGSHFAASGGLVVLRSSERRLTMDVGPLGYLSIAAHGHADALAVSMSVDGCEVIADPGTASYYGHPAWRKVHRGTRVHATVSVDDEDQSVMAGPFMWTRHAQVRTHTVDLTQGVVDAEHDGYLRLAEPVTHRRCLVAPPTRPWVLIVDALDGVGQHDMRASWPLHPALDVHALSQGHEIVRDGVPVLLMACAATVPVVNEQARGDEETNLGWWSDRLESRRPAWLVSGLCRGPAPLVMATVLRPLTAEGSVTALHVQLVGDTITVTWLDDVSPQRVKIHRTPSGGLYEPFA